MCCFCCCCPRPCFRSVFGVCLQTSVLILGFIQTLLTILITLVNAVRFYDKAKHDSCLPDSCLWVDNQLCCPIIKYIGEDAFIGLLCSLFLVLGSRYKNSCLLWSWLVIMSLYSMYVGFFLLLNYSWNKHKGFPQDPITMTISFSILLFYLLGVFIVHSLIHEDRGLPRTMYGPVTTSTPLQEQTNQRRPLPPVPITEPPLLSSSMDLLHSSNLFPPQIPKHGSGGGLVIPLVPKHGSSALPQIPKHRGLPPLPSHEELDGPPPYKP